MKTPTGPSPFSPPPLGFRRFAPPALAVGVLLTAAAVVSYFFFPVPLEIGAPEGPVEASQLVMWIASTAAGIAACLRAPSVRDRMDAAWLAIIALAATFRELDAHIYLNPETLGDWGVRYRIDWWLSAEAPLLPRVCWALAGIVAICLLLLPPLVVRAPTLRLLRAGDAAACLFLTAVGLLGLGYITDDVLRHSPLASKENLWRIEELFELLGAAAFLGSAVVTLRWPLSRRVAALNARENGA